MKKKSLILCALLIIVFIISISVGRYGMSFKQLINVILLEDPSSVETALFYNIRLPRTILVIICGGSLALSGLVFQNIFRNPLVSPDVLGVSTGASIGAILSILMSDNSRMFMQVLTFLTGILTVICAITLSKLIKGNRILSLIISGIVISSLGSSIIMLLKYVADPNKQLPTIEFWLMGGFHNASWNNIFTILPLIIISTIILYLIRWKLKVLALGDEEALTLGINVKVVRVIALLCSTILVSTVVSVAGMVSWIGLIAPHVIKGYAGEDITKTMGLSILSGGIILLFADILSRSLFSAELPISILTSFIGAIFLLYFLTRRKAV